MLLAAADPSSYNLFSGVIRSFCFIIEWRQTMPLTKVAALTQSFIQSPYNALQHVGLLAFHPFSFNCVSGSEKQHEEDFT